MPKRGAGHAFQNLNLDVLPPLLRGANTEAVGPGAIELALPYKQSISALLRHVS